MYSLFIKTFRSKLSKFHCYIYSTKLYNYIECTLKYDILNNDIHATGNNKIVRFVSTFHLSLTKTSSYNVIPVNLGNNKSMLQSNQRNARAYLRILGR